MKDIDFDELDKAVNSVLNQEQQAATPVADTAVTATMPVDAPVAEGAADAVAVSVTSTQDAVDVEPVATVPQDVASQPEASPSLATKRRGKFMDVVHPSSDMNPAAVAATPSTPPVVAPISADMQTPSVTTEATPDAASLEAEQPEAPVETLETPFSPEVDLSSLQLDETSQVPSGTDEATVPVADTADTAVMAAETPETLVTEELASETPFLNDAKIEKRPLGAFGEQGSDATETDEVSADTPAVSDEVGVPLNPTITEPTPRELQSDIVEVEKVQDETVEAGETAEAPDAPEVVAPTTVSSDTGVPMPSGEVSHDEAAHPVFDASTYQQPLTPAKAPGKGKPAWVWWLVGTLGCLLVGGGVGYALFVIGF